MSAFWVSEKLIHPLTERPFTMYSLSQLLFSYMHLQSESEYSRMMWMGSLALEVYFWDP